MRLALVVAVAAIGVALTLFAAMQIVRTTRSKGPTELVAGYFVLMIAVSVVSLLLLRAL